MKQDWFARLYEKELSAIKKKISAFEKAMKDEKSDFDDKRRRDYSIYRSCIYTAYHNDIENNQECKITSDELSILVTLSKALALSQEEVKYVNYLIVPLKTLDIDSIIEQLKGIGVVFYSKKTNTVYIADELVRLLRKVRGREIADKYFRRVLKTFREPQINMICRKHGIDWKQPLDKKIKDIILDGISFSGILSEDLYKEGTNISDRKATVNDIYSKGLKISGPLHGVLLEDKIANIVQYFEEIERDEKVGISVDGYEKMLNEMSGSIKSLKTRVKNEFELQKEDVLRPSFLLDFNIKPRDVIEVLTDQELKDFAEKSQIKTRGDIVINILEAFKDAENLYIENFSNIGYRDLGTLKENGVSIKEANIGLKFEDITKSIFSKLGFDVDEGLRKKLNTAKDKIDVVLRVDENDLILVECKTVKESGYNKFSSVSRQLKSYSRLAEKNGFRVTKLLLVAPEFSDDFVSSCDEDFDLNLSLISAKTLMGILDGFKESKLKLFPYNLLMRDVLIQESRVLKAIKK